MCCTRLAEIQDGKHRHVGTIAQFVGLHLRKKRHISTIGKKLNRNTLVPEMTYNVFSGTLNPTHFTFTCPDNMMNFGLLTAEICWRVWTTPANFNGFCVLAALLHDTLCGVEQRAPPIFGRAAITLGIGPHSGLFFSSVQ